jgi:molybdate transport system substrate-binding protein
MCARFFHASRLLTGIASRAGFTVAAAVFLFVAAGLFSACRPSRTQGKGAGQGESQPGALRPLRVAAAADLEPAFTEIGRRFSAQSPRSRKVVFSFASSAALAQQVRQGAPFDLFAAANAVLVDELARTGQIVRGTNRPYARGRLVLFSKNAAGVAPLPESISALCDPRYTRIAIANPEHAPYGQAAMQALRAAGVQSELRKRLVFAENVRQAHQYVETGNADVAIGALSLAIAAGQAGRYVIVPESLYAPLVQVLGVVSGGDEAGAARFADLVLDQEGQATLARHGFAAVK